jgi:hypothetical protein
MNRRVLAVLAQQMEEWHAGRVPRDPDAVAFLGAFLTGPPGSWGAAYLSVATRLDKL